MASEAAHLQRPVIRRLGQGPFQPEGPAPHAVVEGRVVRHWGQLGRTQTAAQTHRTLGRRRGDIAKVCISRPDAEPMCRWGATHDAAVCGGVEVGAGVCCVDCTPA